MKGIAMSAHDRITLTLLLHTMRQDRARRVHLGQHGLDLAVLDAHIDAVERALQDVQTREGPDALDARD
jgi:hypothetical protein